PLPPSCIHSTRTATSEIYTLSLHDALPISTLTTSTTGCEATLELVKIRHLPITLNLPLDLQTDTTTRSLRSQQIRHARQNRLEQLRREPRRLKILRHRLSDEPSLRPIGRLKELRLTRLRQRLIPADSDRMPMFLGRRSLHTPSEGDSLHLRFLVATPTLRRPLRNRAALTHQLRPQRRGTSKSPQTAHNIGFTSQGLTALKLVQTQNR